MKEQIYLTNVKYLKAVNLTLHHHYTHMCTVSKVIGINTGNQMFLSTKEYINVT